MAINPIALRIAASAAARAVTSNSASTNSTAIGSVDYDEDWETLTVTFGDGNRYKYWNVPQEVYSELIYAGSAGSYFNANIRGKYSYRKD